MGDGAGTVIEYASRGPTVRARMESIEGGVRLHLPPLPVSHRWVLAVMVAGAVWAFFGAVLTLGWAIDSGGPNELREIVGIVCGTFFIAAPTQGLFETVCARWTIIEVCGGRVVVHCRGFPRRRRRREWPGGGVAGVEYRRLWGIRLLDDDGRVLYTISDGMPADQEWLAARLREAVGLEAPASDGAGTR